MSGSNSGFLQGLAGGWVQGASLSQWDLFQQNGLERFIQISRFTPKPQPVCRPRATQTQCELVPPAAAPLTESQNDLQVYKQYLLWGLTSINSAYFGLFGVFGI